MTADAPARRAPVQGDYNATSRRYEGAGTVAWSEHVEAWEDYARRYGRDQSAERIAERGGFGYAELVYHLRRAPTTWTP